MFFHRRCSPILLQAIVIMELVTEPCTPKAKKAAPAPKKAAAPKKVEAVEEAPAEETAE